MRGALLATPSCRPPHLRTASEDTAGNKIAGLFRLSPDWYPPTLVVPTSVHQQWLSTGHGRECIAAVLTNELLADSLPHLATSRSSGLIVRSSAEVETISERGHYDSPRAAFEPNAVRAALIALWESAGLSDGSRSQASSTLVAAGIQPFITNFAVGHMSNEHRVCRDSTSWLVQGYGGNSSSRLWNVARFSPAASGPLRCQDAAELQGALRGVGRSLANFPYRHHIEWVWDGSRLWIVQCDRVPVNAAESPGELWRPSRGRPVTGNDLRLWRAVDAMSTAPERWAKLECRRRFASLGLPVAEVFALTDEAIVQSLADGNEPEGILEDLAVVCGGHVIVRTDVAGEHAELMLPKTEAEIDPLYVLEWMKDTAAAIIGTGVSAGDLAFVAHRFLRSRACAWSYSRPDDPNVLVDSIWGLNDGLSWLPHDSASVNTDTQEIARTIVGKPTFLDVAGDHHWSYRETPTEWIWRGSATEDQLRTIARGAQLLASQANHPVITMWFVSLLDGADAESLPWFQATWDADRQAQNSPEPLTTRPRHVIVTSEDLSELSNRGDLAGHVMQLMPGEALIRDKDFVERVAALALSRGLVVEIDGSPLAHPYYILRRHGVPVYCRAAVRVPTVDEVEFNKLVRDQIPELIADNGEQAVVYRANDVERKSLLASKAVEEALELLAASSLEEEVGEVADLYEVLDALGRASGWTNEEVRAAQEAKRRERGGFDEGYVLLSTSDEVIENPAHMEPEPPLPGLPQKGRSRTLIRQIDGALEISLVPPGPGHGNVFRTRLAGRRVLIAYQGASVTLRVEPNPPSADDDFEQPDLWS